VRSPLPALVLVAALAAACPAHALEITARPPHERAGYVWVEVRLTDLFAPRVASSLARGMPATLTLHAELWRRRAGWFDRLECAFDAELRLRYDFREEAYRIERAGAPPVLAPGLDSVRAVLSRPFPLPVGRVGPLAADSRYYVAVSATLKPLSVEDARQVEGWLSGEVEGGSIGGLPWSLFEAARNFAGFGDEHARALTPDFGLRDLFPAR
jgi:hypothetical protein